MPTSSSYKRMKVVVNDTNIFIDLYESGLLDKLFELPLEIHTVDVLLPELIKDGQREIVASYIEKGLIHLHSLSIDEVIAVQDWMDKATGNVSYVDCAVWYYAHQNCYTLLTGDGQLRRQAEASGVEVHGILYLLDLIADYGIIPKYKLADKLRDQMARNSRLPRGECLARITKWRQHPNQC